MSVPSTRPGPKPAGDDLLVLARCEELASWLLDRTCRWPKRTRFTITQRLENHALDAVDELVQARYQRPGRRRRLARVNLLLERMRHLLRLASHAQACPPRTFEAANRALDEVGRMLYGWRKSLEKGGRRAPRG